MYGFGISYKTFLTLGAEDDGVGRKGARRVAARTPERGICLPEPILTQMCFP